MDPAKEKVKIKINLPNVSSVRHAVLKNWDTCESRGVIWVNFRLSMLINLFFTKITVNELC